MVGFYVCELSCFNLSACRSLWFIYLVENCNLLSEGRRVPEGNLAAKLSETRASGKKDVRFRRTSSCTDAAVPETSFIDMLKKPVVSEADTANGGSLELSDSGVQSGRSGKKKGKKGRQIDPALLGFKVSSNRIMMGEIHRLED